MRNVIEKLLNLCDQSCKIVISAYEIDKKSHFNEKNLGKFNVIVLKQCAETLRKDSGKNSSKAI